MTLADFIRKYLEDRRKACEQKARFLDLSSDNLQFYTDHDHDDNVISLSNNQFFSNNLDPKSNDQSRGSNSKTFKKSIGVSRSSRIVTLPDGTIQVETIIRDSNGNEDKYVTYHKDGKKYTTHTRRDPSGEEVQEKNEEDGDVEIFPMNRINIYPFSLPSRENSDNDYDYWYNKFFKSSGIKSNDERPDNTTVYDPSANMEDQIEKVLKEFGFNGMFRPFPGNKSNEDGSSFDSGIFGGFNDSSLNDEMRKVFENFGNIDLSSDETQMKKGSHKKLEKHLDKMFKSLAPPKPPSLFEQFAEEAYLQVPEENSPLDKFIEPDEERINKLKPIWRKSKDMLEKLEKYFSNKPDMKGDFYSDIEDPKDLDLTLMLPQTQTELPPKIENFGDIVKKTFEPGKFLASGNIQTQMYFGNGKKRTESISKLADGNVEKNILYEIGDQKYNVKIVTNKFGLEIAREKSHNFPKRDLTKFRKQWGPDFVRDLMDE